MDEMLSQEEINALLKGLDDSPTHSTTNLSESEKDAIGEISNISMGTAATTLFSLVNNKVLITTPRVSVSTWDELSDRFSKPCVAIQIVYKEGLKGTNLLILKEADVKIIADLMMGGDGKNTEIELSDLHLSAISEAMNQMIGSAATSMSSMFKKKIDINPPFSSIIDFNNFFNGEDFGDFIDKEFLTVSFNMQIGDLVDSEMVQLYPIEFAKDIYDAFMDNQDSDESIQEQKQQPQQQANMPKQTQTQNIQQHSNVDNNNMRMGQPQMTTSDTYINQVNHDAQFRNVDVQAAQFQDFDVSEVMQQKENINLIMDVPLEVTVELGRTQKSIKEILEFAPGTIIELKKLAGEPIDVLVNGKNVAKGEVVVIDENFGIRITDIIKQNIPNML